jgi:hypothetical protein
MDRRAAPGYGGSGKESEKKRIKDINTYVAEQFRKKNNSLLKKDDGIHLIDRCPLDPLTFGKPSERKNKAADLLKTITGGGDHETVKGMLFNWTPAWPIS